jgi:hypothetical protein
MESSMVTVADIQKDLPNWPKEVIDPWLIEFANDPAWDGRPRNRTAIIVGWRPRWRGGSFGQLTMTAEEMANLPA